MDSYVESISHTQGDVLNYLKDVPQGITFVHGKAGSGKTTLIKKLVGLVSGCVVLAPTNMAANLYHGARTIHSFFWGALDDLEEGYQNPSRLEGRDMSRTRGGLSGVRMIIIDEISMVRSDLFEMMNQICQKVKGNTLPFGGIPLVVVGDLFQLPPIVSDDEVLKYLQNEYGGIYFFDSHVIQREMHHIKYFELTKSYRQENDPDFVKILDAFRLPMDAKQKVKIMDLINSRVTTDVPNDAVYVASSNEEVRQVNTKKLGELPGESKTIYAEYNIQKKDGSGNVELNHSQLPSSEDIYEIVLPSAYDSQLTFKKGARVMFTKNSKSRYINGDFGIIEDFNGQYFTVTNERTHESVKCPDPFDRYKDSQMYERRYEMEYDSVKHRLVRKTPYIQRTKQYPLKLAYAFTIHKAQGQTYEKVILDLNSHIFAPGQLYVALSRAKSLQGLFLTKPVKYSDIISDNSIFEFLSKMRAHNLEVQTDCLSQSQGEISNELCDNFAHFIQANESNKSSQEYLMHTLGSFKMLVHIHEYKKAAWELQKVVDLIGSTYETDKCLQLPDCVKGEHITEEECQSALKTVFEKYTGLCTLPHKQYQSENRTVTINLSAQ
jgi:hypothetical protein